MFLIIVDVNRFGSFCTQYILLLLHIDKEIYILHDALSEILPTKLN